MINSYDKRAEVVRLGLQEAKDLIGIVNHNGNDYASCPNCGHYHAMMPEQAFVESEWVTFNYCRDCGFLGRVIGKS